MTDADRIWAELESDLEWRQAELRALANLQALAKRETEKGQLRRALLVMLYAHTEGFSKLAFLTYVNAINRSAIACNSATDALVAASFSDVFHALIHGDPKKKVFASEPHDDPKLLVFARQREFFEKLPGLLTRTMTVPESSVNTENNLSAHVLKRNLYRLGFSEDVLSGYHSTLNELVRRRNGIAHGADSDPVNAADYERLRKAVFSAMDERDCQ